MRIIGGKHRGRILKTFEGTDIRPTSDRAREALFNILSAKISGAAVLDLFAGTGAIGIEAISRGATQVTFVDSANKSIAVIQKNLMMIGEYASVVKSDAISYLDGCTKTFDLIFIDPPYKADYFETCMDLIASKKLLSKGGIAVFESDTEINKEFCGLKLLSLRRYGKNHFTIYQADFD